ncbi:MAG: DUF1343 domain-containing protein [Myxococcaceae bacterium]|jgi:uncharacterized protein YbbC (DUF1343 family)|nr:DUF1343 domain-containing protein [Myxococcaceae bacterium]MCA3012657.1 DUF1343 domain-containing protein [Myxococcaceae bacterium]
MAVRFGIDVWVKQCFRALRGLRVGAIVNPTSVDASYRHLVDLLHGADHVTLAALFGPEHGVRGEAQYMVAVDDVPRDARTGVPVHSLYGHTLESLSPKPSWLQPLDALVFDIQDVGARYYTYIYTMALAMKAAARAKLPFFVLDRPNPIGLDVVQGNLVGKRFRSFVGLYELPTRHGMSAGEIARLLNERERLGCELTVVPCEGLRRSTRWEQLGRDFISPSPNMPTPKTALVYPGMCLGEGTNVSEGRGTCRPFEQFGAPWLRGAEVADHLNALRLPGVTFRACAFTPTFDKFRGSSCEGAFLHVTDARAFDPFVTGIAVFQACHALGQGHFAWRADAYEFVDDVPAFDLLCGTAHIRKGIEAGWPLERLVAGFEAELEPFLPLRKRHLIY